MQHMKIKILALWVDADDKEEVTLCSHHNRERKRRQGAVGECDDCRDLFLVAHRNPKFMQDEVTKAVRRASLENGHPSTVEY